MSNFIIRQEGASSTVADNIWEFNLGLTPFLLGALAGTLAGLYLGKRGRSSATGNVEDWPVNIAHRGGKDIAPENTLEGFREGIRVGAGVLELDVHQTADGHLVVIHDETVDRTTNGSGFVREMTLREVKRLDAGYKFPADGSGTYPYRGRGVTVPTLEEVYREFPNTPMNVEIKGRTRPGIEQAVWRTIETAGAEGRTLVVSQSLGTIRRFRKASGGRVATASSTGEMLAFDLLNRVRLSGLLRPDYQALQGPEFYPGRLRLHMVTPGFVRTARKLGIRVDVWTINTTQDMRRLLAYGVNGLMTDRPDLLAGILQGDSQ